MKSIVAVDNYFGIGKNNDLLFHLPLDMEFFRNETLGKVIVMGSNTLKSFPNGKPLKGRTNIVLFPGGDARDDCIIVQSLEELSILLKNYLSDDIYIVGGAMFYKTMLAYCDTALVTKVDSNGEATVFYPNLDNLENWNCISSSAPINTNGYTIIFNTYKNKSPIQF